MMLQSPPPRKRPFARGHAWHVPELFNFFQFYVALDRENHGKVLLSKAQHFTVDVVPSCASYGEVLRTGFWEYVGKRVLIHMYIPPFSTWWFHLVSCTKTT
jgi:hypothetical protein